MKHQVGSWLNRFLGQDAGRSSPNVCQVYFDHISWETYLVALAIVIPGKWIECSQLHPPPAELFGSIQCKATYIRTHLEGHKDSKGMCTSLPLPSPAPGLCFLPGTYQLYLANLLLRRLLQCDGTGLNPMSTLYCQVTANELLNPFVPQFPHFVKVGTLGF